MREGEASCTSVSMAIDCLNTALANDAAKEMAEGNGL